jgi:hypothetical protein
MILLFHYSRHAFNSLLASHFDGPVLRRLFAGRTGAPKFGGVSARLLLLLLLHMLMAVLQLQFLLVLRLLQLLLLQVDPGPVVVRYGCCYLRSSSHHRLFRRGTMMLPAEHSR